MYVLEILKRQIFADQIYGSGKFISHFLHEIKNEVSELMLLCLIPMIVI